MLVEFGMQAALNVVAESLPVKFFFFFFNNWAS